MDVGGGCVFWVLKLELQGRSNSDRDLNDH
jgi:hypothetical protein